MANTYLKHEHISISLVLKEMKIKISISLPSKQRYFKMYNINIINCKPRESLQKWAVSHIAGRAKKCYDF